MKLIIGLLSFLLFNTLLPTFSIAQLNMILQDSMDYNVGVNDVCGWAAPDGREYALVGLNTGVSIVDINSDTIHEVALVPGQDNLWRDINTFGHYAYVSSEAHIGLLIIDLQYLPDSVHYHYWFGVCHTSYGDQTFQKAHSLNIDENGILFLNGSNLNNGGCVLVDVKTDPENPICLGYGAAIYSHDCLARDSILYSAEIYPGYASIYDFHDINNITLLGQVKTPHEFTHNIALSDDSKIMFTTDERPNSYTTAYDISDKTNIRELDRFRQAAVENHGAIVHNVFTWDEWLILAYYSSGTLIVDASRPDNLVEVGNFDSFIGADGNYEGVWGAYPYLPSGKVLASDRTSGLFVFIPHYVHAAFLEGSVVDSLTGEPLSNATVQIQGDEIVLPQFTKFDGTFKTGKAIPGTFPIQVAKEGYYTKTILTEFVNGEVLTPVIKLKPRNKYAFTGHVIEQSNSDIPFANVTIYGDGGTYQTIADANGFFDIPQAYQGTYEMQAGIWGQTVHAQVDLDADQNITLTTQVGYRDNFDTDLGWVVSGNATEGQWTRGVPSQQFLFDIYECGSATDSPEDIGINAFSTGLSHELNVANDEVSGGTTWLSSPPMDLDSISVMDLSFDYWLCEFPPNQYVGFTAYITNGADTTLLQEFENDSMYGTWQNFYQQIDFQGPRDSVRILFSARDTTSGTGDYYLKVHVDNFNVSEGANAVHDPALASSHFITYPNPVNGPFVYLRPKNGIVGNDFLFKIVDVEGRFISSIKMDRHDAERGIPLHLNNGIYFLQWTSDTGENGVEKIIVLR